MPTKTEKTNPKGTPEEQAAPAPTLGVLFQLEDIAVNGRKMAFDALKDLLHDHKMELTATLFSRYCLHSGPQSYLPELLEALGARKVSVDKLAGEMNEKVAAQLSSGTRMNAGLEKILQGARERNMAAAAITTLPEATAQSAMAKAGLEALGVRLFAYPDAEKTVPGATAWLKTAKALALKPHHCAVLAGNMAVCKAALSADMRCVAIPDEFTSFQDYGGAFLLLEALNEMGPRELLDVMFPAPGQRVAS